jgi:cysteine desulfurase
MIYLDNAASTPMLPEVRRAMEPALEAATGNPSSPHAAGREARRILEDARAKLAAAIVRDPREIVFTSGATEANHLALLGAAGAGPVAIGAGEHPCVRAAARLLERRGTPVRVLPLDASGRVDPSTASAASLTSIMAVNNETGTIQPVEAFRAMGLVHSDAVQALGRVPLPRVDLLTLSGHKIHGPKGVGALVVPRDVKLEPLLLGGGQEFQRRAGTENVAGAVGLAEAAEIAVRDLAANAARLDALRRRLRKGLEAAGGMHVLGGGAPQILCAAFEDMDAERLILALDASGVCISSGSACASLARERSAVLEAMGVPEALAAGAVRFSLSILNTEAEMDEAARVAAAAVRRLRKA